jgi:hypothetical protein
MHEPHQRQVVPGGVLRTFAADGVDAIRFLISAAMVMKAASTLVASVGTHIPIVDSINLNMPND